jgi:uncharacterized membrane protein
MSNAFSMPGDGSKYQIDGVTATFLSGLWHGLLITLFFIISLFNDRVGIYEANNNGGWYNLGFLIGIGAFAGNTISISVGSTVI